MATCNDCIHRTVCVILAVPDAFENTKWDKEPCDHFKAASVAPRAEWISVEDRLPDGNGRFLTVDEKGDMMVCYWEKHFGWFASVCNKNAITNWMPLPEPPKGD